ncbi:MAG: hypothetical protein R6W69_08295 [Anaerolineales bacterium]
MRQPDTATGNQLANALNALGVNFILGGSGTDDSLHRQPARLIAALAMSEEARLRLSLIPLFLEHPEYAEFVRAVVRKLDPAARLTLQCYYSAAVWFQRKYYSGGISLPDHFSKGLGLEPVADPDDNLRALAKRHKELSGSFTNWLGTYQHAVQVWHSENHDTGLSNSS